MTLSRTLALALVCLLALPVQAATRQQIDAEVREAIQQFHKHTSAGRELAGRAAGMLVFPKVYKGGIGLGGEYGEGALIVGGRTAAYYNIVSGSVGLQLGVQRKSEIILFMTPAALAGFRRRDGWKAGVDGSVALATLGAGAELDSETVQKPIIGFIFGNEGLMYNLTFEGSKISRITR
jgi:lipid-binding SYLF domain-containing protein